MNLGVKIEYFNMSNTEILLAKWEITVDGNYLRAGYLVRVDVPTNQRVIIDPQGNQLPEVYPYFYLAVKHVNALLDK